MISRTGIPNLSLILSNDPHNQLSNLLLYAADGRLRLKNLVAAFEDDFDLLLIDTQGARSVMLEMALLCSDMAISPITPDMLAAREFYRGGDLNLESHIEGLMRLVDGKESEFLRFSEALVCEIRLSCVIYCRGAPPLSFEKRVTRWVASIGAALDIDIYLM